MREKDVEQALVRAVKARGGLAFKWVSPGRVGIPDRLLVFPNAKLAFVEVKAPGARLKPQQIKRRDHLVSFGFHVWVVDGIDQIGGVIDAICSS